MCSDVNCEEQRIVLVPVVGSDTFVRHKWLSDIFSCRFDAEMQTVQGRQFYKSMCVTQTRFVSFFVST